METRRAAHPAAEVLKAFGLGKLDDSSTEALMAHLDLCGDCRKVVGFAVRRRFPRSPPPGAQPQAPLPLPPSPSPTSILGRNLLRSRPRSLTCRRNWPTIRSTRSSANSATAAWALFTWPRTN